MRFKIGARGPGSTPCWAAVALLAACFLGTALASSYDPHVPNFYDPYFRSWFEGYYIRITPTDAPASRTDEPAPKGVGLILAAMPRGRLGWNISLASMMIQGEGQVPLKVLDDTGMQLAAWHGEGEPVTLDPSLNTPPNFTIAAENGGAGLRMVGDECSMHATIDGMLLEANCTGPPRRWGPDNDTPEGPIERLPTQLVGCHWTVFSLGTPMIWRLRNLKTGAEWTGAGTGHFEKNWGATFPAEYVWAQGVSVDATCGSQSLSRDQVVNPHHQAAFALAGGKLPLPSVPTVLEPTAFLVGIRSAKGRNWSFRPWDPMFVDVSVDGCAAGMNLTVSAPLLGRRAVIRAATSPDSFGPITCPTYHGFLPFKSVQSWTARVRIELYESMGGWREMFLSRISENEQPVEVLEFEDAGLEFGGAFGCKRVGPAVDVA